MTRLVALFFAAIALLLTAYWVVPGAKPPEMVAVQPTPSAQALAPAQLMSPAPILPQTLVRRESTAPLATAAPLAPALADSAPQRAIRTADGGCDGDPIKCMLEGRNHRPDPIETTGSIVPRKPVQKPAPKPVSRPQP